MGDNGDYFYMVQLAPGHDNRVKFGISASPRNRANVMRNSSPGAVLRRTWTSERHWEPEAIAHVKERLSLPHVGGEVYECDDLEAAAMTLDAFFAEKTGIGNGLSPDKQDWNLCIPATNRGGRDGHDYATHLRCPICDDIRMHIEAVTSHPPETHYKHCQAALCMECVYGHRWLLDFMVKDGSVAISWMLLGTGVVGSEFYGGDSPF